MRYLSLLCDLVAFGLVVAGLWLLAPWLALVVAGVVLAVVSLLLDGPPRKGRP